MNIGLFTDTFFPQINGVGTSVHLLAEALEKKGHQVYIFTPSSPNADKNENNKIIRMPSMPFLALKGFRIGTLYSPLALKKISHLHLDIVHTQTEFPLGMFGKFLSVTQHIPMVHTYHTMYEDYVHYIAHGMLVTPAMAKEFSKLFCNTAKAVIAPTSKAQHYLEECGVKKPIYVIPTGIDTSAFAKSSFSKEHIAALKLSYSIDPEVPVILFLGRIAKEKSIDVIIRAMPALLSKIPNAVLLIVGDGPERGNLEDLANTLQLSSHVIFAGAKPWVEIGQYYQLADVFVSASQSETQGLTFAEAMAGGIPVVAKKDPSLEGFVMDGKNGLLFEEDDTLADTLFTILSDESLQKKYAKASLETVASLSVEAFADQVEAVYNNVLEQSKGQEKVTHTMLPTVMGVGAVKKIRHIPHTIVKKGLKASGTLIGARLKKDPLSALDFSQITDEKDNKKEG